jgi:hypothetical protein
MIKSIGDSFAELSCGFWTVGGYDKAVSFNGSTGISGAGLFEPDSLGGEARGSDAIEHTCIGQNCGRYTNCRKKFALSNRLTSDI